MLQGAETNWSGNPKKLYWWIWRRHGRRNVYGNNIIISAQYILIIHPLIMTLTTFLIRQLTEGAEY